MPSVRLTVFCSPKPSSRCHGSSTVRAAQQHFVILLLAVVGICLFIELLQPLPVHIREPVPVFPRQYLTSECGYERRLGNVMFTYAAMLGIAKLNNLTAVISYRTVLSDIFSNLSVGLSRDMKNTLFGAVYEYHEFGRRGSAYDRGTQNLFKTMNRTNVYLRGYFQSWRYFDNVADLLRANFVFREGIAAEARNFLSLKSPPRWLEPKVDFVRVGIHVRRGDMVNNAYFKDYGYTVAPPEYFAKAMAMFVKQYSRVQFVVCSDDIQWCEANIPSHKSLGDGVDVVFSKRHSQFEDIAILSLCDHIIMSVGSFGWWAAWLANGTTVYYENWPRPSSMLEYHVDKRDYFPSHWIKLS